MNQTMSIVCRRTKLNIKAVSWEHMKMKTYENIWKWKQQQKNPTTTRNKEKQEK